MTQKQVIVLLVGLPASGKSGVARAWVAERPGEAERINYDDLRLHLNNPFTREGEKKVKAVAMELAEAALAAGKSVIIDNTNLTERARGPWLELGKRHGIDVDIRELGVPVSVCVERDRQRQGTARVGRAVIERMALFSGHIDWDAPEYGDRKFVIVDMDGTLADCSHRRPYLEKRIDHKMDCTDMSTRYAADILGTLPVGWRCPQCGAKSQKDYDAFYRNVIDDPPIAPIVDLVNHLSYYYTLLVVSGRPVDKAGLQTEEWLERQDLVVKHLFMRNGPGDHRPDTQVKQEILGRLPKDRIAFVLDDRSGVVEMWRRNGLTCLQVAPGDF